MRRLIYGDDERLIAWAEARIPQSRFRPDAKAIGVTQAGGEVQAVFVYDTFSGTGCFMHVAAEGRHWLPDDHRTVMTPIFAFPFLQCGFARISCVISARNRPSLAFATWCGCRREGLLREAAPDGSDYVLLGMLRRECRWILGAGKSEAPAL